ncbi:hypothetical protein BN946_scf184915.g27 [Trametes cinnabarina]|uniref:DUF6534 domain-containing protein n=1 Tax=Pycnoporus cinnabarinus TaxID=5643 RepID=A0A060SGZ1_PYCCI|nr:hypothetical protein BN946_scf184915.g27 [Trametes cinnabarina]
MTVDATLPMIPTASNAELTRTFGVLLIGFIFTATLYGLTFFQTYIYYTRFPADDKKTKCIAELALSVTHTFWSVILVLTIGTEFSSTSNTLLLLVSHLGRRTAIPAIVIALSLAAFVSVAKITNEALFSRVGTSGIRLTKGIAGGIVVAVDVLIAGSMLFYLRPVRNPGMVVPEGWYDKVVVYGVNRGTCFAIFHVAVLITLVTMPSGQVWILFHWISNKGAHPAINDGNSELIESSQAYVNSVLSMLNFRNTHHGRGLPEEATLNQHARGSAGRTGTYTTRSGLSGGGGADTSHSVQFNVHADNKSAGPMNIELDMMRSQMDTGFDDVDSEEVKRIRADLDTSGGPSKLLDLERVSE